MREALGPLLGVVQQLMEWCTVGACYHGSWCGVRTQAQCNALGGVWFPNQQCYAKPTHT
jgi:hypothetical protein